MRILSGILFSIIFFSAFSPQLVTAQKSTVELRILDSAIYNTQQKYLAFMGTAVPLYYGPEYVEYFRQLTNGHPFFLNNKFNLGTIKYDNILYENIRFKYDEVQDKLAIADAFSGTTCISPSFEKVSSHCSHTKM